VNNLESIQVKKALAELLSRKTQPPPGAAVTSPTPPSIGSPSSGRPHQYRMGGEPNLYVEVLVKVVFFIRLS
jgi:hypothetical protein